MKRKRPRRSEAPRARDSGRGIAGALSRDGGRSIAGVLSRDGSRSILNAPWFWPAVVFAVALFLRIVYVVQIRGTPFFHTLGLDAKFYDNYARDLLGGQLGESRAFFMSPLYPYFLAAIYRLFGRDLFLVRVIQTVIGSLSAVLVYHVGLRAFGKAVGIISGLLLATCGALIFYDGSILLTPLMVLLCLLVLLLLFAGDSSRRTGMFILAGLVLGLAAVGRPTILVFAPLAMYWVWSGHGHRAEAGDHLAAETTHRDGQEQPGSARSAHGPRGRARRAYKSKSLGRTGRVGPAGIPLGARAALLVLLGVLIVVVPVTIRNYAVSRDFVLITSNGGLNFYIGNSESSTGGYVKPEGLDIITDPEGSRIAETALGRSLKPSEVSAYWYSRAKDYLRSHPGEGLRMLVRKLSFVLSSYELPQLENYYFQRRYSSLLSMPLPAFGVIAPLGILGMIISFRRRRSRLLALFFVAYVLPIAAFFFVARYRAPAVPALIITGSFAVVQLWEWLRQRLWRNVVVSGCGLAALAFIVNYNFYDVDRAASFAQPHYRLGIIYSERGMVDRAIEEYRRSIEIDPGYPKSHLNLGAMLSEKGDNLGAAEAFRGAIRLDPDYAKARLNLALVLEQDGQYEKAITHIDTVLALEPFHAGALKERGVALYRLGRLEEAERTLEDAARADETGENGPEIRFYLARIQHPGGKAVPPRAERALARGDSLGGLGRVLEAADAYEEAARLAPGSGEPIRRKALLRRNMGLVDEAVGLMREALALDATLDQGHFQLGVFLSELGRHDEAVREYKASLSLMPDFAPAHLNLGLTYQFDFVNHNLAEYHYRRYLEIGGERASDVEELLATLREGR